jgi:hypothetical protein
MSTMANPTPTATPGSRRSSITTRPWWQYLVLLWQLFSSWFVSATSAYAAIRIGKSWSSGIGSSMWEKERIGGKEEDIRGFDS